MAAAWAVLRDVAERFPEVTEIQEMAAKVGAAIRDASPE